MSIPVNFNGNTVIEPGVYSRILGGVPAREAEITFGNLVLIDTGLGKNWGGGSGVSGVFSEKIGSVYDFTDVNDFQGFVKGGIYYDLAKYIFAPYKSESGPNKVSYIRAATTTPATISLAFENANYSILVKNEGSVGNGLKDETLGRATVQLDQSSLIADTDFTVTVGANQIADGTILNTSMSQSNAIIVNAINSADSGYTAKISGSSIIVYSKPGTDASTPLVFTGVTVNTAAVNVPFVGYEAGTKIAKGYGVNFRKSIYDSSLYVVEFIEGSYTGMAPSGADYNGMTAKESLPKIVASFEFNNHYDLESWMNNNASFRALFSLDSSIITGTGLVTSTDYDDWNGLVLASGGSEVYNASDLDAVIELLKELDFEFILSDKYNREANSVENQKIIDELKRPSEFQKFLVIGGGNTELEFDTDEFSSVQVAKSLDSEKVHLVHGGVKRFNNQIKDVEILPSIYFAANFVGRLCGLEPQVPITFKNLKITDFVHDILQRQREKALQAGVIHQRDVAGMGKVINQGVNTLQRNTQLFNPDGTSYEISIMRISSFLNKSIVRNLRPLFVGSNRGRTTAEDVKNSVTNFLRKSCATDQQDNLIVGFEQVTVRLVDDYYDVKYGFYPNGPINKVFMTGFMLDKNIQI